MKIPLPALLILAGLLMATTRSSARTWTNAQGRTFEAEFVRLNGAEVIFSLDGGKLFAMPLKDLSAADHSELTITSAPHASAGVPVAGNFGYPWPRDVRTTGPSACKVISEDPKAKRFIYESAGYRFICDARVTDDALRNFSVMFETTKAYAQALPLSLQSGHERGGKFEILLFADPADYVRSGALPGSAGCFVPARGLVLVPMESLGLKKGGTGFSLDIKRKNTVLVYELVHQLTPRAYFAAGAMGWFSEGLAEYMAATPYSWGYFAPDSRGIEVRKYATGVGAETLPGRHLGAVIKAPRLRDFMLMGYGEFTGANANFNYGLGLLITHYFFHMEGGGKASRITNFLKGLQAGQSGEAALAPLLGGSNFERLESEITAAWARNGVDIHFGQ